MVEDEEGELGCWGWCADAGCEGSAGEVVSRVVDLYLIVPPSMSIGSRSRGESRQSTAKNHSVIVLDRFSHCSRLSLCESDRWYETRRASFCKCKPKLLPCRNKRAPGTLMR